MAVATGLTIEEYEALPEALARNHELVKGELVEVSGNTVSHNELRGLLEHVLRLHVEKNHLGGKVLSEQEYDLGEETTHAPDVSYFSKAKLTLCKRDRRVQLFVPDFVIEIASSNDRFGALAEKMQRYLAAGIKEAWLFWPSMRAAFYVVPGRQPEAVEQFQPAALPGFSAPIHELFERAY